MTDDVRNLICLKCCPKCGGAMFRECDIYGCDVECLNCGHVMPKSALEQMIGVERTAQLLKLGVEKIRTEDIEKPKRGRPRKGSRPPEDDEME